MADRVTVHTVPDANGHEPPVSAVAPAPTPGSIVARLRERAKAQQATKTTELAVGGEFGNRLWIKYGVLPPAEMDRFVASRQGVVDLTNISATSVTMDMMARACIGLVGRYEGEEEELTDEQGVIRLEDRLARLLDLRGPSEPVLTSHEVITRLFGRNGAAITTHGDKLVNWLINPTEDDAVGESSGGAG
jgi:hypothetical protein